MTHYYFGLDLGQKRDYSAVAVVERVEPAPVRLEWAAYLSGRQEEREATFAVRHLERVKLGTSYPDVVERVRELTRRPEVRGRTTLVVDGTGVGQPVVDLLVRGDLDCELAPVTITGGAAAHRGKGCWHVPKRDLVGAVQVLIEQGRLQFAAGMPVLGTLIEEMMSLRMRAGGQDGFRRERWRDGKHDDLALALALACWRAKRG